MPSARRMMLNMRKAIIGKLPATHSHPQPSHSAESAEWDDTLRRTHDDGLSPRLPTEVCESPSPVSSPASPVCQRSPELENCKPADQIEKLRVGACRRRLVRPPSGHLAKPELDDRLTKSLMGWPWGPLAGFAPVCDTHWLRSEAGRVAPPPDRSRARWAVSALGGFRALKKG
jgi:hypothetical protein